MRCESGEETRVYVRCEDQNVLARDRKLGFFGGTGSEIMRAADMEVVG